MNKKYYFIALVTILFAATGCNKYLDVQPEASYSENQVYGNENALNQAINGIYIDLADRNLYGAALTTTFVEMLAQRSKPTHDLNGVRDLSVLNYYQYGSPYAQSAFDSVWRKAYSTILATNVFLSKIDNSVSGNVISREKGDLLKGEAMAIRAMLHFDMLRLFGPVYATGSSSNAIPYYTATDAQLQPLLPASQVVDKVVADLTNALTLLAKDPIITTGVVNNKDFYAGLRNQRFNYFAVKALLARTYIWAGKTDLARTTALGVLNEGEKWFPWTTSDEATVGADPDKIFSKELLMGLYNPSMYSLYDIYFSPALSSYTMVTPDPIRLGQVYENNVNDYRYKSWQTPNAIPAFIKYAPPTNTTLAWRFIQPLIRKSELYFILAETEPNAATELDYLNNARRRRGLAPLGNNVNLGAELRKEYQKEFWGEGQLFFYYKRLNIPSIPDASMPYDWALAYPVYVVPLPLSETTTR